MVIGWPRASTSDPICKPTNSLTPSLTIQRPTPLSRPPPFFPFLFFYLSPHLPLFWRTAPNPNRCESSCSPLATVSTDFQLDVARFFRRTNVSLAPHSDKKTLCFLSAPALLFRFKSNPNSNSFDFNSSNSVDNGFELESILFFSTRFPACPISAKL